MKKASLMILAAVMLIFFAGCGNSQSSPEQVQDKETSSARSRTARQESLEETGQPETETPNDTIAASTETEAPSSSSTASRLPQKESTNTPQPASPSSNPPEQKQNQSAPSAEKPESQAPASQPSAPQPQPSDTPPAPTPEPEPEPEFNISGHVQFAKDYGATIGLVLDSSATACWDNPLTANSRSKYLQEDIIDTLNSYKNDGFTHFWVWSESQGGGSYLLYIGYA